MECLGLDKLPPDKWFCSSCEEKHVGEVVWAKVRGFPYWPGIVQGESETPHHHLIGKKSEDQLFVLFFGKKERTGATRSNRSNRSNRSDRKDFAWVNRDKILPFEPNLEKFCHANVGEATQKWLSSAVEEACKVLRGKGKKSDDKLEDLAGKRDGRKPQNFTTQRVRPVKPPQRLGFVSSSQAYFCGQSTPYEYSDSEAEAGAGAGGRRGRSMVKTKTKSQKESQNQNICRGDKVSVPADLFGDAYAEARKLVRERGTVLEKVRNGFTIDFGEEDFRHCFIHRSHIRLESKKRSEGTSGERRGRAARASGEKQKKKHKKREKEVECGDQVSVPAYIFGEEYAKESFGPDWRSVRERGTVIGCAKRGFTIDFGEEDFQKVFVQSSNVKLEAKKQSEKLKQGRTEYEKRRSTNIARNKNFLSSVLGDALSGTAEEEKDKNYIVSSILDHRFSFVESPEKGYKLEYYIKWENFSKFDATWEPEENCSCPRVISEYWKKVGSIDIKIPLNQSRKLTLQALGEIFKRKDLWHWKNEEEGELDKLISSWQLDLDRVMPESPNSADTPLNFSQLLADL